MKVSRALAVATVVVALVALTGCVRQPLPEPWKEVSSRWELGFAQWRLDGERMQSQETVALGTAKNADVRLEMKAGEMTVDSAMIAPDLMRADFEHAPEWKPEVSYMSGGDLGELEVTQPDLTPRFRGSNPNSWDVTLAEDVPMDLEIQIGAGTSDIDLSRVDVRRLLVNLGAGESKIDLSGSRATSVTVDVRAGVGQLTVVLPRDVGVRVAGAQGGIGDLSADGFAHSGTALVNDAYGKTPASINVAIARGIGEVVLELK